ncbi:MAG TPA: chromate efflux transporter [Thermoanaerobaculia bacterium]|nr:chromate efflux transporter [Thermoanaerobaculia bacterium]
MKASPDGTDEGTSLREIAVLFLKLGATVFGGPAAHIARMREEVIVRRSWMTDEDFFDLLATTNFIPGPNSTEMAIHVGNRRAGWRGLVVAGVCFIFPAAAVTLVLAWAYTRFGSLPVAERFLHGVKPVIIAIVAHAIWSLGRTAIRSWVSSLLCAAALIAAAAGVNELVVLLATGVASAAVQRIRDGLRTRAGVAGPAAIRLFRGAAIGVLAGAVPDVGRIFLAFLKIGSVLFGSGYVLLAFLRTEFVTRQHWLTERQLLDAVIAGQVTPGPVFSTATFIGYLLAGVPGGIAATAGIFLPAFVFVALTAPLLRAIARWPDMRPFLDGLVAGSLALMALVAWQLGRAAVVDWPTALISIVSAAVLFRFGRGGGWLILGGGLAGLLTG